MTRVEAKELLPIIQAYSEGKTVEYFKDGEWTELKYPQFSGCFDKYRIKPEIKYRPFKNADECWEEMLKHQPFGWLEHKSGDYKAFINSVNFADVNINDYYYTYEHAFNNFEFIDGTPFGIKIEEE